MKKTKGMKKRTKVIIGLIVSFGVIVALLGEEDKDQQVEEKVKADSIEEKIVVKEEPKKKVDKPKPKKSKVELFVEEHMDDDYRVIVDEFISLNLDPDDWRKLMEIVENKNNVSGSGIVVDDAGATQYEDLVYTIYIGDNAYRNDESLTLLKGEYYEEKYLVTIRLSEHDTTLIEGDKVNFAGVLGRMTDNYHYIDSSTITNQ